MIVDTNALSAFADGVQEVVQHVNTAEEVCLPVIVLGEYRFGIASSRRHQEYERWLTRLCLVWEILPIIADTALHYAVIRRELKSAGTPLPANDVWVAALARQHQLPVLSRDEHFDAVTGLSRVSW